MKTSSDVPDPAGSCIVPVPKEREEKSTEWKTEEKYDTYDSKKKSIRGKKMYLDGYNKLNQVTRNKVLIFDMNF